MKFYTDVRKSQENIYEQLVKKLHFRAYFRVQSLARKKKELVESMLHQATPPIYKPRPSDSTHLSVWLHSRSFSTIQQHRWLKDHLDWEH